MKKSEEKNKKTIIILLIVVIAIIAIVIYIQSRNNSADENLNQGNDQQSYVEEIEDGIKINKSTKLNETKEVQGLQVTNIQLTLDSGMTTLLADVTNNSGEETDVKNLEITLLREDGSEIATVSGILKELAEGETTQLNITTTSNYIDAYDFSVKVVD